MYIPFPFANPTCSFVMTLNTLRHLRQTTNINTVTIIYKPFNGINIGVFHDLDKLINIMQYISISQSKLESPNLIVIEIIIAANI